MLSDEDKALFRQAVQLAKPLKKDPAKQIRQSHVPRPEELPTRKTRSRALVPIQKQEPEVYLSSFYPEEVQSQSTLSYSGHQIPLKRMRELKQGRIHWGARLDLHGFKPDEAQRVLLEFIKHQTGLDQRCLLIIHGKGSRTGEAPILKNLVNHWLRQLPQVLAFHSAVPKDGGTGALYVLLKRNRENHEQRLNF